MANIRTGGTVEVPTWILIGAALIIALLLGLMVYNHEKPRWVVKTHGPYTPAPQTSQPITTRYRP